jgi:glycerophosphoryl diester phosphodiesterase
MSLRARVCALACLLAASAPAVRAADELPLAERLRQHPIVAHRGGYPYDDSNTLTRFEQARLAGAPVVEMDLRLSSDGVVFLFHDKSLQYATDCKGPFESLTAAQIERCKLKGLDRGPDRFERILQWSQGRVVLDAELKTASVVKPAIELVRRYGAYEWVYFQVRNGLALYREVRKYDARVALEAAPVGPHAKLYFDQLLALNDPKLLIMQLHAETLSAENLRRLHESGKLTSMDAWRVTPERTWSFWPFSRTASCLDVWRHGIDIAITNDPEDCLDQHARLPQEAAR